MGSSSRRSLSFLLPVCGLLYLGLAGTLATGLRSPLKHSRIVIRPEQEDIVNDRPIIGILAQELYEDENWDHPNLSYIAASYVKFIEGGGGRVVPIFINETKEYYERIFAGVNGILFPGGGVFFNDSGYSDAGKILIDLALDANDRGDYFPIWGTCLGFEFFVYDAAGDKDVLARCNAWNVTEALNFTAAATKSKLFAEAPEKILTLLSTQRLTANFHRQCLTQEIMAENGLDKLFNVLSWNYDENSGITYVSSMESFQYPIYGVQFHPEKNIYEWNRKYITSLPHSRDAIAVGQYFADFFVSEARKSSHTFASEDEENQYLIYNYNPTFTGAEGSTFVQKYIFQIASSP